MSSTSSCRVLAGRREIPAAPFEDFRRTIRRQGTLALNGLCQMFDSQNALFCYTLKQTERGLVQEGISHRYSMITLMGLHRLEESGQTSPIEIQPVFQTLLAKTDWVNTVGDLGLLLWLCALIAPERLPQIKKKLGVDSALARYGDARQGRTMELAWFLTGLSHASLACPDVGSQEKDMAAQTYALLARNQGEHGIFGHVAANKSVGGALRSRIGNFADQVYPIYGMTKFSQAFGHDEALEKAEDCALAICDAQGPFGQWWWHYDSLSGRVVEGYPVFSVHQHGMGPMALFELGEALNADFSPWIYKGLQWVNSENELAFDMEDVSANVIWRSIYRPSLTRYWDVAIGMLGRRRERRSFEGLKVRFECRPYELGWLLYAFANRSNGKP